MDSVVDILENQWTNPFNSNPSDIVRLSTSTAAPLDVARDLLNAQNKGERVRQDFQRERLQTGRNKQFHDRIPRIKLKTFYSVKKQRKSLTENILYYQETAQILD